MKHPFEVLGPEYSKLLSVMAVRPERKKLVDDTAVKLIGLKTRWAPISEHNGVPIVFMATSFEREATSNFSKNPAQGWSWRSKSRIIPYNGPFPSWTAAALEAYRLNGLDQVGRDNWTWELMCFYGETFNGFGYRDYHRMHSPYLWGCSNVQTVGKYTADGKFDPGHWDEQIGIIPVARRMIEIDPTLALPASIPAPVSSGVAKIENHDTLWVQTSLNRLGAYPALRIDGSYGRKTMLAVKEFQRDYGLQVDGYVGPKTTAAIAQAIQSLDDEPKERTDDAGESSKSG